jgi:putative endonuclease
MNTKPDNTTTVRGCEAERLAALYLERRGQRVIERNFRVRGGEIDLICKDGNTLVFVEVRLRSREDYGGAGASITPAKRRRIILAARHYLARRGGASSDCRFDCILMSALYEDSIEWIRHAFAADD